MILRRLPIALLLVLLAGITPAQPAPLPESAHTTLEFATPGDAYRALRADRGVKFRSQDGWVIADDRAHGTVWTFSPHDDPAFPSVVKRRLVERAGAVVMEMGVLCGASKQVCDDFVRKFQRLNDDLAGEVRQRRAAEQAAPPPSTPQ